MVFDWLKKTTTQQSSRETSRFNVHQTLHINLQAMKRDLRKDAEIRVSGIQ